MNRTKRAWIAVALLLLTGMLVTACGQEKAMTSSPYLDGLTVSLAESPVGKGSSTHAYKATVRDQTGSPADVDRMHIDLSMTMQSGMHHQTEGKMVRTGTGIYAAKLKWTMNGNWIATLILEKDGHRKKIRAVTSNH